MEAGLSAGTAHHVGNRRDAWYMCDCLFVLCIMQELSVRLKNERCEFPFQSSQSAFKKKNPSDISVSTSIFNTSISIKFNFKYIYVIKYFLYEIWKNWKLNVPPSAHFEPSVCFNKFSQHSSLRITLCTLSFHAFACYVPGIYEAICIKHGFLQSVFPLSDLVRTILLLQK